MAFTASETGVCLNAEDLISKLNTFCAANGYTVQLYSDNIISGTTRGKRLHLSKNGKYYNIVGVHLKDPVSNSNDAFYNTNNIGSLNINTSTAFNSSNNWFTNTNSGNEAGISTAAVRINSTYWFYSNSKTVIVIIKYTTINYSMLAFGETSNYNPADSLVFSVGSNQSYQNTLLTNHEIFTRLDKSLITLYNNTKYSDVSGSSLIHPSLSSNSSPNYPAFSMPNNSESNNFIRKSTNVFTGTSVFFAIEMFLFSSSLYAPVGLVDDLFYINFKDTQPEQILEISTDKYIVFPFNRKFTPQDYSQPGLGMGIAIKFE